MIQTEERLMSEHRDSDGKQLHSIYFHYAFITLLFELLFHQYFIRNLK